VGFALGENVGTDVVGFTVGDPVGVDAVGFVEGLDELGVEEGFEVGGVGLSEGAKPGTTDGRPVVGESVRLVSSIIHRKRLM
jgi:hypothetical protein